MIKRITSKKAILTLNLLELRSVFSHNRTTSMNWQEFIGYTHKDKFELRLCLFDLLKRKIEVYQYINA